MTPRLYTLEFIVASWGLSCACQNVFNEYGFALENGGYGVDQIEDTIAQYQAALDEAGYQDVLAAFQAQYDEWKAENGSETTDESVEEESSSVAE